MLKSSGKGGFKYFVVFIIFISFSLASLGCEPLRKKFTRKKKKGQEVSEEMLPVLSPIDYAPKIYTPEEKYRHSYGLWKIWSKDLLEAVDEKDNDKRQKYNLSQAIVQLTEMKKLVVEDKQKELEAIVMDFNKINNELDKPQPMRDYFFIRKTIEQSSKKIRNNFNLEAMKNSYVSQ